MPVLDSLTAESLLLSLVFKTLFCTNADVRQGWSPRVQDVSRRKWLCPVDLARCSLSTATGHCDWKCSAREEVRHGVGLSCEL